MIHCPTYRSLNGNAPSYRLEVTTPPPGYCHIHLVKVKNPQLYQTVSQPLRCLPCPEYPAEPMCRKPMPKDRLTMVVDGTGLVKRLFFECDLKPVCHYFFFSHGNSPFSQINSESGFIKNSGTKNSPNVLWEFMLFFRTLLISIMIPAKKLGCDSSRVYEIKLQSVIGM